MTPPTLASDPTTKGKSPWAIARRRFLRNIPATVALGFLVFAALASIFAYPLSPDDTHNANFQIVELPKQAPGTKASLLLQPQYPAPPQPGFLGYLLNGRADAHHPLPVRSWKDVRLMDGRIQYLDLRGNEQEMDLAEFMLPIDKFAAQSVAWKAAEGHPYQVRAGRVHYVSREGGMRSVPTDSLEKAFQDHHVVERTFHLGTDTAGRDVLSRLLLGGRVTLGVGFMAVLVSLVLGIVLGSLAGFFRGWVDNVVMWFVSVVWSIPTLLLAIAIAFALGKGGWQLFLAIGASTWVEVARIVRGQIFSLREMQYVEAARALGFTPLRTIFRHVLPNAMGPVIIVAAANFASAVLVEAGLSFLGMGVQPPIPSWGGMVREGYTQIMFDSGAWLAIFPGLAMILVVICLNLVGFGLRDALDPKFER